MKELVLPSEQIVVDIILFEHDLGCFKDFKTLKELLEYLRAEYDFSDTEIDLPDYPFAGTYYIEDALEKGLYIRIKSIN